MKTRFNRREFSLGALAAGTALASAGRPARAQAAPVKIRVGWVVVPASLAPLILEKKDILKHFGQSYVAEATRFEGTPPVITALASGELDIGPLAFSSFGLAIQNAHMDDLRVISDEIQDGVAGPRLERIHGAQGRPGQNRGRPQGQGARHQCHGQRRRHRHAGDAARRTASKPTRTTPSSRRPSRPCARCWRRKRPT